MSQVDVAAGPLLENQTGLAADNNQNLTRAIGVPFTNNDMNITRNNNTNQNPLFRMRDRLFHALFIKASLAYARTFPKPVRRFIEFIILLKVSMGSFYYFFFLIYYGHLGNTLLIYVYFGTFPYLGSVIMPHCS